MRKPFKSSVIKDQQIVNLSSRSQAIVEKYEECEPPPTLHKLDPYREDGKSSMKFYTDPGYFFDLWSHEMAKDTENQLKKQKHRNKKVQHSSKELRQIRQPRNHVEEYRDMRHGPEFVEKLRREHDPAHGEYQQHPGSMISTDSHGSMRPSSLEIQKLSQTAQAYLTGQGTRASEYGYIFNNGPLASRQQGSQQQQQYQSGSNNHNQAGIVGMSPTGYQGEGGAQDYRDHDRIARSTSEYQARAGDAYSPDARRGPPGLNQSLSTSNSRPSMPPPAPPMSVQQQQQQQQQIGRSTSLAAREMLPPPPPAPQPMDAYKQAKRTPSSVSASAAAATYQLSSSPKGKTRNSFELPPPPTPPPLGAPPSHTTDLSPNLPPPAPSFVDNYSFRESEMSILPPSPPLLPPPSLGKAKSFERSRIPNSEKDGELRAPPPPPSDWTDPSGRRDDADSSAHPDDVSNSDTSSVVGAGGARVEDGSKTDEPLIRDTRSDLLSAIREGLKLRKVEERRLKTEQKQQTTGRLDVQSIMEAAFELRRKALESNDSDKEDDEDGNWSDEG